ncbi:MAG: hypothetical protein KJ077_25925 [Anaerolineae bacterium]|nr:hypothetical protein [Anaerolineae bacterium]
MPIVIEATLEQYVYYLRRVEGDTLKAAKERQAVFEKELRTLLAHLERLSGQIIPPWEWPQEHEDHSVSQRIVRTGWLDNSATGRSYFVEARTYGDVYWLQAGYYQQGQAEPEIFTRLSSEAWQPAATDHLLGSSCYLCGIAADEVDELAARVLTTHTGNTLGPIVSTHLSNGCARIYGLPRQLYITGLFYPNAECEARVSRTILNNSALRLELYKHKTDRQLAWCEATLPVLSEQERALRDLLEKAGDGLLNDIQLLQQLARLYRVFNDNVGMLTERQMTIGINLDNLGVVLEELKPSAKDQDHLLSAVRENLRGRQAQLEANMAFADQARQQAERTINALTAELALGRLVSLRKGVGHAVAIERTGWPGAPPLVESEIESFTPHPKPSQSITYPRIEVSTRLKRRLTAEDKALLQQVYRGYGRVLVEKEFGGGLGGAQVLQVLPIAPNGRGSARKVTKMGPAIELRQERDNYVKYVEEHLPFSAARVEWARYYEQGNRAGLNYVSIGGGSLGQVVDLEEYYRDMSPDDVGQVIKTLGDLLDRELGQNWYSQNDPLRCFFVAEYSQYMVAHLRLKLRRGFSDTLWLLGEPPAQTEGYEWIEVEDIPYEYEAKAAGALLAIEGMVVKKIKHGEVNLQDPDGQGTIVSVEFESTSNVTQGLELGSMVGVRGEVVYNRHERLEQIVRSIFPDLSPGVGDERIKLPGVAGTYPNPLKVYPDVLGRMLEGRQSSVHGDLNLRNILVDESGVGRLIDFAKVEERHNLFDFIRLETYLRLMELAHGDLTFSLDAYVRFEIALNDATLGQEVTLPDDPSLKFAYQVILAIRRIAQKYMGPDPDFRNEYFPALFLYCLAVTKYYENDGIRAAQLVFATACVQGGTRYLPV